MHRNSMHIVTWICKTSVEIFSVQMYERAYFPILHLTIKELYDVSEVHVVLQNDVPI